MGEGEESSEILDIASSPISSIRYTAFTSNDEFKASSTIFSPSTINIPSASRNFFCDRDLIYFISPFDNIFLLFRIRES